MNGDCQGLKVYPWETVFSRIPPRGIELGKDKSVFYADSGTPDREQEPQHAGQHDDTEAESPCKKQKIAPREDLEDELLNFPFVDACESANQSEQNPEESATRWFLAEGIISNQNQQETPNPCEFRIKVEGGTILLIRADQPDAQMDNPALRGHGPSNQNPGLPQVTGLSPVYSHSTDVDLEFLQQGPALSSAVPRRNHSPLNQHSGLPQGTALSPMSPYSPAVDFLQQSPALSSAFPPRDHGPLNQHSGLPQGTALSPMSPYSPAVGFLQQSPALSSAFPPRDNGPLNQHYGLPQGTALSPMSPYSPTVGFLQQPPALSSTVPPRDHGPLNQYSGLPQGTALPPVHAPVGQNFIHYVCKDVVLKVTEEYCNEVLAGCVTVVVSPSCKRLRGHCLAHHQPYLSKAQNKLLSETETEHFWKKFKQKFLHPSPRHSSPCFFFTQVDDSVPVDDKIPIYLTYPANLFTHNNGKAYACSRVPHHVHICCTCRA